MNFGYCIIINIDGSTNSRSNNIRNIGVISTNGPDVSVTPSLTTTSQATSATRVKASLVGSNSEVESRSVAASVVIDDADSNTANLSQRNGERIAGLPDIPCIFVQTINHR